MKLKTLISISLAIMSLVSIPNLASADDHSSDAGLEHPWHIALGSYIASGGGTGFAVKADRSFFRATRHEAVLSAWYLNTSGTSVYLGTGEYRWRFGGHGKAYYALGLGYGTNSNHSSSAVATSGWGYEFGKFTAELRSFAASSDTAVAFLLGTKF